MPTTPCLYRGEVYRGLGASDRDGRTALEVFSCGRHGECTLTEPLPGVRTCGSCPDYRPRPAGADSPANSVAAMAEALRGPRRDWPDDWPYWGTALEAHRLLAAESAENTPPYPEGRYRGRGIVILGGGTFFPGVYVAVRMIRHFGCGLPIELWHHAETEPVEEAWLAPFGVRCVDTDAHMDRVAPARLRGGWTSKFYGVLHSSFEEVLYLDSDCYPVADLTGLFDLPREGAAFWPDFPNADGHIGWHAYPATPSGRPPLTGGHFVLDKRRCWKELLLAQWWNERADYVYRHGYGDQDVLRGVWEFYRTPFTLFEPEPRWDRVAFLASAPGRGVVLVHRCLDKFRLPGVDPRCLLPVAGALYQGKNATAATTYQPGLPGEDLAFGFFDEFKRLLFQLDQDPARFRPGTADDWIWKQVVLGNEYRLPDRLPAGEAVVDVGGHVGAFTHAACRRGAGRVFVYEPEPDNFAWLGRNLAAWGDRVTARRQAVWSHACRVGHAPGINTGAGHVFPGGDVADAVPIDEVLREASAGGTRPISVLKLDCEGSEWPILSAARDLSACRRIVGEYHLTRGEGAPHELRDLCRLLARHGFTVTTEPYTNTEGLFWATRAGGP